jgi:hypothetical protein
MSTLEFRRSQGCAGGGAVILGKQAPGGTQASWGPATLAPVTSTPASGVDVRYSNNFTSRTFGTSALLFGYNPSNYADQLQGALMDDAFWATLDDRCTTPTPVGVGFRDKAGSGNPTEIPLAVTAIAGGGCDPPVSVQAASLYDRGVCAARAYLDDLFPIIADGLWAGFYEKVNENDCADAERRFLHLGSYIQFGAGDPNFVRHGGFVLHFDFGTDINAPVKNNNVYFNYSYEFGLDDGIVMVSSSENGRFVNGFKHGSLGDTIAGNLREDLPSQVRNKAEQLQTRVIPIFTASCTQEHPGDPLISQGSEVCTQTRKSMRDAMQALKSDSSLPAMGFPPDGADRLAAVVDQIDGNGKLKNIRCLGTATSAQCALVLRAKRLNVYPDVLELVWLDSFHDVDNSGALVFHLARTLKDTSQICTDPGAAGESHPLSSLSRGFDRRDASGGVLAGAECIGAQLIDFVKSHSWLGSTWVLR